MLNLSRPSTHNDTVIAHLGVCLWIDSLAGQVYQSSETALFVQISTARRPDARNPLNAFIAPFMATSECPRTLALHSLFGIEGCRV